MTVDLATLPDQCEVAIIGGGPSGLAAATRLRQLGINSVHVLEREPEAGGIPRHCGHPPFGMREFQRCLTGPAYARALVERARRAGVIIHTDTTVAKLHAGGKLTVSTDKGCHNLTAKRVVLSTGVRETPRSARFVTGQRPLGILTTGALQSMVYLKHNIPFRRPVIVGTELVSFSALLTSRHAGIKPVAMIEQNEGITARTLCRPLPALLGVPLLLNTQISEILGKDRVEGVRVTGPDGKKRAITCDGVLFTGQFTPESSLMRMGHMVVDPGTGGPMVDQFGRCSDPAYFATGNLLRPVETAGWCWQEGVSTGEAVANELAGSLPAANEAVAVITRNPLIKFVMPQSLSVSSPGGGETAIQLRFADIASGRLFLRQQGKTLWSRTINTQSERRVLIPVPSGVDGSTGEPLEVCFE